ncbi:MAG: zinc ribbon domain-containing protein, partial [Lachnospiraceae bacterium]|nr:zinc ribbon domain-containing protein [Lachnospiraceae bacterium]
MICSNCGKEINDGSKFCIFCGGSQQTAAPVEATPVAPVAPVEAAPVAPVAPVEAAPV